MDYDPRALEQLQDETLDELLIYLSDLHRPALTDGLHDKQLEAFRHPSKRKAIVCGRRGGKTTVEGVCCLTLGRDIRRPASMTSR